jgi:hypothetical protein
LLQRVVAFLPGWVQECTGGKGHLEGVIFKCWGFQSILLSQKCVYISVSNLNFFLFSLNPLMRKSETVAFDSVVKRQQLWCPWHNPSIHPCGSHIWLQKRIWSACICYRNEMDILQWEWVSTSLGSNQNLPKPSFQSDLPRTDVSAFQYILDFVSGARIRILCIT